MSNKKRRNETSERRSFKSIKPNTTTDEMERKWAEFKAQRKLEIENILRGNDPFSEERQKKLADYIDNTEFEAEVLSQVMVITAGNDKFEIAYLRATDFDAGVNITYQANTFEDEALEELFRAQYLSNNIFPDGTPFRWKFRGEKKYHETSGKYSLRLTHIASEICGEDYVMRLRQLVHKEDDMLAFIEMQNEIPENAEIKAQLDMLHQQMGTEKFVEMLRSLGGTMMVPTLIGGIPYVREVRDN